MRSSTAKQIDQSQNHSSHEEVNLFCTNFVPPSRERWHFRIYRHCIFCNLQDNNTHGKNDPVSGHHIFNKLQALQPTVTFQNARRSRSTPIAKLAKSLGLSPVLATCLCLKSSPGWDLLRFSATCSHLLLGRVRLQTKFARFRRFCP